MTVQAQLPVTAAVPTSTFGTPTWITTPERSLLAWYHQPESGSAKGVVVIAPPIGREQVISYRTLRILAIMLAEQGWAAIRFSWSNTGESEDLPADATLTKAWKEDLETVRSWAQSVTGFSTIHAIGLRIGASLLASEDVTGFGTRIAWEPIAGKKFLRQHAALRRLSVPEIPRWDAQSEEIIGALLPPPPKMWPTWKASPPPLSPWALGRYRELRALGRCPEAKAKAAQHPLPQKRRGQIPDLSLRPSRTRRSPRVSLP